MPKPPRDHSWESAGGEDDRSDDKQIDGKLNADTGEAEPVGEKADASADDEDEPFDWKARRRNLRR